MGLACHFSAIVVRYGASGDGSGGFDCVKLEVVGGVGNTTFGVTIWGCEPRFAPVPTTTLQEIVV